MAAIVVSVWCSKYYAHSCIFLIVLFHLLFVWQHLIISFSHVIGTCNCIKSSSRVITVIIIILWYQKRNFIFADLKCDIKFKLLSCITQISEMRILCRDSWWNCACLKINSAKFGHFCWVVSSTNNLNMFDIYRWKNIVLFLFQNYIKCINLKNNANKECLLLKCCYFMYFVLNWNN